MTIKNTIELEKIVNSELASKVDNSSINYGELLIEIKVEELINVINFLKYRPTIGSQ